MKKNNFIIITQQPWLSSSGAGFSPSKLGLSPLVPIGRVMKGIQPKGKVPLYM